MLNTDEGSLPQMYKGVTSLKRGIVRTITVKIRARSREQQFRHFHVTYNTNGDICLPVMRANELIECVRVCMYHEVRRGLISLNGLTYNKFV